MIAHLTGVVLTVTRDSVLLDVHGVGYRVRAGASVLSDAHAKRGNSLSLYTHLAVREDALDLYGFETEEELSFFVLLIGVSGVGPRSALAIMNLADVRELSAAIARNDASSLTRVSGIGKKTAEKVVLELRDKVGALEDDGAPHQGLDAGVIDALISLGYAVREAREALKLIPKEVEGESARLREALRLLGKN